MNNVYSFRQTQAIATGFLILGFDFGKTCFSISQK